MKIKSIKIYPKNKGNLLANTTVTIESEDLGEFTINWIAIWATKEENDRLKLKLSVSPPSLRMGPKYFKALFFKKEETWFEIEKAICEKYEEENKMEQPKGEYVDPEEIPF